MLIIGVKSPFCLRGRVLILFITTFKCQNTSILRLNISSLIKKLWALHLISSTISLVFISTKNSLLVYICKENLSMIETVGGLMSSI